jgi:RNA polymerase sigma-70 factor (ECF subfamily)
MDMHIKPPFEDLLLAVASGERDAFAALYRASAPQLFALALRILKRRDAAEEVLQEAFVNVWRHAVDYRPEKGSAIGWMATIVRNRALDRLRRARPETPLDEASERHGWADSAPDPLESATMSESARRLDACLERLEDGPRRAIRLAYYEGLTHEALATRLGAPLGTVKSWVRRGLMRLKTCLESGP